VNAWSMVALGDHVDLLTGYPFKSKDYTNNPDDVRLISGYNIMQGHLRWDTTNRWPISKVGGLERYKLQANDVVLAMDRPWVNAGLKYAWMRQDDLPCLLVQRTARLRGTKTLDVRFLRHLIGGPQFTFYVKGIITGTAVPHISPTDIKTFRFLLPPLPEQRKIADILGIWDAAIALTEQLIEAAQQRKKGLMQRLLTGRVRFPEFVRSERGQETQFGYLPIDWKVVPLQKLVKPVSRPETIQPGEEYEFIGVKWYVAGAHIHSVLSGQDIKTTSLSRIEENDIVYNKMWTTKAAFAVAKPEHSGAYGTTEYPQFRAKENMLFVGFLEYIFHLARFQYDATALCRGTTGRARLNPRDFLKLEIPLPSLEEQHRIAAVLQTCEREIEVLTQKRDALQRQKKGLMQRLLTGRVRVSV